MSMTRSIQRNIARERMQQAGIKHISRKGYATNKSQRIRHGKAFRETVTSLFALNWRKAVQTSKKRQKGGKHK